MSTLKDPVTLIEDFDRDCDKAGLSLLTRVAYKADLRHLANYLATHGVALHGATEQNILNFLDGKEAASSATRRRFTSIRRFYHFLVREGHASLNPIASTRLPPKSKQVNVSPPQSRETLNILINTPDASTPTGRMRRLALLLMAMTDLKPSQLANLTLKQINLESGKGPILKRGEGIIQVTFEGELLQEIRDYVTKYRPLIRVDQERGYLFPSRDGGPFVRQTFWVLCRRYGEHNPRNIRASFRQLRVA
jgi:integrase/recombinase XerD